MKPPRLGTASAILVVGLFGLAGTAGAKKAPPSVSLFAPYGYIQPGAPMYDFAEVRLQAKRLTGHFAACEEFLTGTVVANGEPTDIVAFTESSTDEYCEGQMHLTRLPRIEYSASGTAQLAGMFIVELPELGCTYGLEHLSSASYGRHLQVSMTNGRGRLSHKERHHGSCPKTVTASFSIYGAYDSPFMGPGQMDSRTIL